MADSGAQDSDVPYDDVQNDVVRGNVAQSSAPRGSDDVWVASSGVTLRDRCVPSREGKLSRLVDIPDIEVVASYCSLEAR